MERLREKRKEREASILGYRGKISLNSEFRGFLRVREDDEFFFFLSPYIYIYICIFYLSKSIKHKVLLSGTYISNLMSY